LVGDIGVNLPFAAGLNTLELIFGANEAASNSSK
jgi:hypothetical protein